MIHRRVLILNAVFTAILTIVLGVSNLQAEVISRDVGITLNANNLDTFDLDVVNDPAAPRVDFTLEVSNVAGFSGFSQASVPFNSTNGLAVSTAPGSGNPQASILSIGDVVSSTNVFSGSIDRPIFLSDDILNGTQGNFNGQTGFFGFQFADGSDTLFGYANISVSGVGEPDAFNLTLNSVTYESTPGQSITIAAAVPEPGSASALLIASLAITSVRFRRRKAARKE